MNKRGKYGKNSAPHPATQGHYRRIHRRIIWRYMKVLSWSVVLV